MVTSFPDGALNVRLCSPRGNSFGMYHEAKIGHGRRCLLESRSKDAYVVIVLI